MEALELRDKLIEQFNKFIQDDSKLLTLDGIFDAINTTNSASLIPEDHYKIVEDRRSKMQSGETKGLSWNDVRRQLKKI